MSMSSQNHQVEGQPQIQSSKLTKLLEYRQSFCYVTLALEGGHQLKAHKMEHYMEQIFNEVNQLVECQQYLFERAILLEQKRKEIFNRITDLGLSPQNEARKTLENELNKLEIKLTRKFDNMEENMDEVIPQTSKKCRYHDGGYCRRKEMCKFMHSNMVCKDFISKETCLNKKQCLMRHPKNCKYWKGDPRGCLRGDTCKYLHRNNKAYTNVTDSKGGNEFEKVSEKDCTMETENTEKRKTKYNSNERHNKRTRLDNTEQEIV